MLHYTSGTGPFARAALAIVILALACARSYPLGKLSVKVVDANGAPVFGVAADLFKVTPSGSVYWRASRTSSDGVAVFGEKQGGVIEAEYVVHISLMPQLKLAPGETNDRALTLTEGQNIVVLFRVVPSLPRRPPALLPP